MPSRSHKTNSRSLSVDRRSLAMAAAALGALAVIAILATIMSHRHAGQGAIAVVQPGRVLVRTPDSASCTTYSFDNQTARMTGGDEKYCYDDLWHGNAPAEEPMHAWRKSFRRE